MRNVLLALKMGWFLLTMMKMKQPSVMRTVLAQRMEDNVMVITAAIWFVWLSVGEVEFDVALLWMSCTMFRRWFKRRILLLLSLWIINESFFSVCTCFFLRCSVLCGRVPGWQEKKSTKTGEEKHRAKGVFVGNFYYSRNGKLSSINTMMSSKVESSVKNKTKKKKAHNVVLKSERQQRRTNR